MSYTITYTNGKILAYISDQATDSVSTSLDLVGKNSNAYGSSINNNFVHLLENFANRTAPRSPITGQLWYDTVQGALKVYSNNIWKSVGTPVLAPSQPSTLLSGEFWFDTVGQKLWYYNGVNLVSLAKPYSDFDGKNGALAETVIDQDGANQNIIAFYVEGSLVGWFSDKEIILNLASNPLYIASTTVIHPGFTLNPAVGGQYFNGTATSALSLAGLTSDQAGQLTGLLDGTYLASTSSLYIYNDNGIGISPTGNDTASGSNFTINNPTQFNGTCTVLSNNVPNSRTYVNFTTAVTTQTSQAGTAILIDGAKKSIGIFTTTLVTSNYVDVNAAATIRGNLTANTTGTAAYFQHVYSKDGIIDLGTSAPSGDDVGIRVNNQTSAKYWTYNHGQNYWTTGVGTDAGTANINARDTYYLYGQYPVLSVNTATGKGTLGDFVETAAGIKTLSALRSLTVGDQNDPIGQLVLTTATISSTVNMYFKPATYADFNFKQIRNVKTTLASDPDTVVTTKDYVDNQINAKTGGGFYKPYTVSIDVTGFTNTNAQVLAYLNKLLPVDGGDVSYYSQPTGSRCTVLCSRYTATTATFVVNLSENKIPYSYTVTSTNTVTNSSTTFTTATTLVTDVAGLVTVTGPLPTVQYQTKLYQVVSISTQTAATFSSQMVSYTVLNSGGAQVVVQDASGIVPGATMSNNGFTSNQIVVAVLNTNTIITNTIADGSPSQGGVITFTTSPGFKGWVYIKDIA